MYLGLTTGEVIIGGYKLKGFHQVEIKKSVHQIVQTAKLIVPASVIMHNNDKQERIKITERIKEGDAITISFGYDYKNRRYFTGYIRRIDKKVPVTIECEDELFVLRRINIKKTFNSSLKEVLMYLVGEVNKTFNAGLTVVGNVPQIAVANFVVNDRTALWTLQQLKDWYPMLSIRLIGNQLHVGMLYNAQADKKITYALNGPKCNVVSVDQLKFDTTDQTVKVVYEITKDNGTVEKKQFGDTNGDLVINKKVRGAVSDAVLKEMADTEIMQRTYSGFRGSFDAFLFPEIEPDTIVQLKDPQFGRDGNYYVGTVVTTFGVTGGRHKPEIDFKLR